MRKKAKYLHDAPNEALIPGLMNGRFNRLSNGNGTMTATNSLRETTINIPDRQTYYVQSQPMTPQNYGMYPPNSMQQQMSSTQELGSQQSPVSPGFPPGTSQQSTPMQISSGPLPQSSPLSQAQPPTAFVSSLPDPHDPTLYNFDLASLNFGNHYGALEFGMLGHMSSGAMEAPPIDKSGTLGPSTVGTTEYAPSDMIPATYAQVPGTTDYIYGNEGVMTSWQQDGSGATHNISIGSFNSDNSVVSTEKMNGSMAHGYTIGAGMTSPDTTQQGFFGVYNEGSTNSSPYPTNSGGSQQEQAIQMTNLPYRPHSTMNSSNLQPQGGQIRRSRDPSSIYEAVTEPYSYTAGFHALTAFLQRRFPPQQTLRIAKALASIRPSFISCTKPLNQEDLIFMEKCFQRTLWEYEDFISKCATPTIVCRRTGEVAAVGKEFSILTGWKKEVLLGKEPNLNVNIGGSSGYTSTGSCSRGTNTPKPGGKVDGHARPQPVFLAELLDDDSVIRFYEDFARMAFGDSRGSVTSRCKLLKYKIRDGMTTPYGGGNGDADGMIKTEEANSQNGQNGKRSASNSPMKKMRNGDEGGNVNDHHHYQQNGRIAGESSIHRLESQNGTVDCICCWTVKRDVFDMPMLIVMNVSNLVLVRQ